MESGDGSRGRGVVGRVVGGVVGDYGSEARVKCRGGGGEGGNGG